VVNGEGKNLITFCESSNLEILNGSREGDVEGKMTYQWQVQMCIMYI
jgi:hypothetical protein